jgi:hypothetical protein
MTLTCCHGVLFLLTTPTAFKTLFYLGVMGRFASGAVYVTTGEEDEDFPHKLYQVSRSSGESELIGDLKLDDGTSVEITDMSFYDTTSTMFALIGDDSDGGNDLRNFLTTIDISTAEVTLIGDTTLNGVTKLSVDSEGIIWGIVFNGGGDDDDLVTINNETGVATVKESMILELGNSGNGIALAFDSDDTLHVLEDNSPGLIAHHTIDTTDFTQFFEGYIQQRIAVENGDIPDGSQEFWTPEEFTNNLDHKRIQKVDLTSNTVDSSDLLETEGLDNEISTLAFANGCPMTFQCGNFDRQHSMHSYDSDGKCRERCTLFVETRLNTGAFCGPCP